MYRFKPKISKTTKMKLKKGIKKEKIKRHKQLINNLIMKCVPIFLS